MTDEMRRIYKERFRKDMEPFIRRKVQEEKERYRASRRPIDPIMVLDTVRGILLLITRAEASQRFSEQELEIHREVIEEIIDAMKHEASH